MIEQKDVIRMKVAYPSVQSGLAYASHMYICRRNNSPHYEFIKTQTLKPYMLNSPIFIHYVDEQPDISRNPFEHATRIDCDKMFTSDTVSYDDSMKTTIRTDVSQELFDKIMAEFQKSDFVVLKMDENNLCKLNPLIEKI